MDDAETIVEKAVSEHRGMIKQMKGVPGVMPERFEEGMDPRHCALSLVGEPIMYPEIDKFVGLLHAKRISTFLVTNAQFPDAIKNLPAITQLYVSVDAATPETLKAIDRPLFGDYWVSVDARPFHRFFFPHTPSLPVAPLVKQRLLLSWAHVCRVVPIMMLPEDPARWYQSAARDKWSTTFPPAFPSLQQIRSNVAKLTDISRTTHHRIASSVASPPSATRTSAPYTVSRSSRA